MLGISPNLYPKLQILTSCCIRSFAMTTSLNLIFLLIPPATPLFIICVHLNSEIKICVHIAELTLPIPQITPMIFFPFRFPEINSKFNF